MNVLKGKNISGRPIAIVRFVEPTQITGMRLPIELASWNKRNFFVPCRCIHQNVGPRNEAFIQILNSNFEPGETEFSSTPKRRQRPFHSPLFSHKRYKTKTFRKHATNSKSEPFEKCKFIGNEIFLVIKSPLSTKIDFGGCGQIKWQEKFYGLINLRHLFILFLPNLGYKFNRYNS